MQPKEQSRDNGGDALSQPQPQIDREIDHTQALQNRIWKPSLKKLYKGKIWAFWTKLGLFWDHFCTFLGLLVVIFIKMPPNLQKAKKGLKTV